MARRPSLGIGGPITQPRPIVQGEAAGRAETAQQFARAFGAVHLGAKPVAQREAVTRGQIEAQEAIDRGEAVGPRSEFFLSGRAFNQTASRVLATRTATDAQVEIDKLVREQGHDPAKLQTSLNGLKAGYVKESAMGAFPQLRAEFEELFERQRGVALRQAGEMSAQLLADQDLAAAQEAIQTYERGITSMALRGGSPDELGAQTAQFQDLLAQFGPRGEFELNGRKYAADEGRSGALTVSQIQRAILGTADNVDVLRIQGQFERTKAKGAFARQFKADLMSGRADVDPAKGLALLNSMEAEVRSLNAEARAARSAARAELRAHIGLMEKSREAGFPVKADWAGMEARAAGDPALLAEIRIERFAAEQVQSARPMTLPQRQEQIAELRSRAAAVADAGGVDLAAMETLTQLEAEAQKMLSAVTEESTGLAAAGEVYAATGQLTTAEDFAAMRERAAGKPELIEKIDTLETQQRAILDSREMTPIQRQEFIDDLQRFLTEDGPTIEAGRKIAATISALERDQELLRKVTNESPADAAAMMGRPIAPLDTSSPDALAGTVLARAPVIAEIVETTGAEPKLLRPEELMAIDRAMDAWPAADRLRFVQAVGQLPDAERSAIEAQLQTVQGGIGHVSAVANSGNLPAAEAALRGAELRAAKIGQDASAEVVREAALATGLLDTPMEPAGRADIMRFASDYARGRANGGEVTQELVEEGIQAAMFRQEDGRGGLVESSFGFMILPPSLDVDSAEALVYSASPAELEAMNGGKPLLDANGDPVTPDDIANGTLQTVEPGRYIVRLEDGSGVAGDGPGGNFVLDLIALGQARAKEQRAALPALGRAVVSELQQDQLDAARQVFEFEQLQQSREDFRESLIRGDR